MSQEHLRLHDAELEQLESMLAADARAARGSFTPAMATSITRAAAASAAGAHRGSVWPATVMSGGWRLAAGLALVATVGAAMLAHRSDVPQGGSVPVAASTTPGEEALESWAFAKSEELLGTMDDLWAQADSLESNIRQGVSASDWSSEGTMQ